MREARPFEYLNHAGMTVAYRWFSGKPDFRCGKQKDALLQWCSASAAMLKGRPGNKEHHHG
jgi:hypothetical protein